MMLKLLKNLFFTKHFFFSERKQEEEKSQNLQHKVTNLVY